LVTEIPFVPAFNSLDLEYPRRFGPFGTIGTNAANTLVQEADIVLILGCRMNIRQIGYNFGELAKRAYKIMVDMDEDELHKSTFRPDLAIRSQVGPIMEHISRCLWGVMKPPQDWLEHCEAVSQIDQKTMPLHPDVEGFVNPYRFIQALNKRTNKGEIVVSSNGMASIASAQMLDVKEGMRYMVNSGAAAMGYGLPASIGAAFAAPRQRILCLEGDGSLQMNIQELQTVAHHNLPIKLFVFNNNGYNSIRNTADNYFDGRYFGTDSRNGISFPNLRKIAEAYGIPFHKITRNEYLESGLDMLDEGGPMICELMIDPNSKAMPKGIRYE
jgi:acetolactate synthase-1/2/3 large subunit